MGAGVVRLWVCVAVGLAVALSVATASPSAGQVAGGVAVATTGARPVAAARAASSALVTGTAPRTGPLTARERAGVSRCWRRPGSGVELTFDDYGSVAQVKRIVAILDRNHLRGRFFPIGEWASSHPGLIRYIAAHGHAIGNHTYDHPDLTGLSGRALRREITNGARTRGTPALLRPPYGAGAFTRRLATVAGDYGLQVCFWTVDTRDWAGASAATIVRRVLHGDRTTPPARKDGVVLMHMFGAHTAAALQPMIDGLRAKHVKLQQK